MTSEWNERGTDQEKFKDPRTKWGFCHVNKREDEVKAIGLRTQ